MDQYDEDLLQNPFFQNLKTTQQALFEHAAERRWTICVPRAGSLSDLDITLDDLENHILVPQEDDLGHYLTVNKKEVHIKNSIITTYRGFAEQRTVPILFEETYFNKNEESYSVLCINQPLEGGDNNIDYVPGRQVYSFANKSAEECANLLWGTTGNPRTRKQLSALIDAFLKRVNYMNRCSLKDILVTVKSFFDKAMGIVMNDPYMKRTSNIDEGFLECVKLAVETHLMHGVHKRLFKMICTCQANKNAQLNKITRNLSHVQLQELGVRMEYCQNVPKARKELSNLSLHRTPIGKLNCLKKVITALTKPGEQNKNTGSVPLTTDDLLPILIFLVLKADIPTWWSHFEHISSFRFSKSCLDNEYGFYLASLEAALEHVSSGKLLDLEWNLPANQSAPKTVPASPESPETNLWHKQDQDSEAIEQLFQYAKDNNKSAVLEILQRSKLRQARELKGARSSITTLCHPLCTCERCKGLQDARERERTSHVTEDSRDARGFTVLHVAAFHGHVEIADIAIKQGALVNGADYLNQTPLHIACKRGNQAVTLLLLHSGAFTNARDGERNTPLHLAAVKGHEDCAKALVFFDQGACELQINATNDFGDTALHLATKWGYESLVSFLLENGASALIRNRKRHDPLRYAYSQTLCDRLSKAITEQSQTRMMHKQAMMMRRIESLQDFRSTRPNSAPQGLPPKATNLLIKSTSTALPPKVQTPKALTRSVSEVSLRRESLVSQTSVRSRRPSAASSINEVSLSDKKIEKLLRAVADGDINMAKYHLGWMSDSDDDSSDLDLSKTELCHPLCQCQTCQPVQKFTTASSKRSIHVNTQDQQGNSPLHVATRNGHVTLMELLLKRGANANLCTVDQQCSPLHLACKQRKIEAVEVLLRRGAEVNLQDADGNSPLHYCCMMGNERKAQLLIKHNAQVNIVNRKGNTPLHDAVRWNFLNVVRLLLKNGAQPQSRNSDHKLPLHYAQTESMNRFLRDAMANKDYKSLTSKSYADIKLYKRSQSLQSTETLRSFTEKDDSQQKFNRSQSMASQGSTQEGTGQVTVATSPTMASPEITSKDSKTPIRDFSPNDISSKFRDQLHSCDTMSTCTVDSDVISIDDIAVIDVLPVKSSSPVLSDSKLKSANPASPTTKTSVENVDDDIVDSAEEGLTLIDNYFEDDGIGYSIQHKCRHDNSNDSDCCSENSKTESQQDLSLES